MSKIIYVGAFFTESLQFTESLPEGILAKKIAKPHVTCKYNPTPNEVKKFIPLLGRYYKYTATAYGNDGKNEGLKVQPFVEEFPLNEKAPYYGAEVMHITLSIAEGAKAVDTANIEFNTPYHGVYTGRLGFYMEDGSIVFSLPYFLENPKEIQQYKTKFEEEIEATKEQIERYNSGKEKDIYDELDYLKDCLLFRERDLQAIIDYEEYFGLNPELLDDYK